MEPKPSATPNQDLTQQQDQSLRAEVISRETQSLQQAKDYEQRLGRIATLEGMDAYAHLRNAGASDETARRRTMYIAEKAADSHINVARLSGRINKVMDVVSDAPVALLQSPDVVHDPHKAEYMAYEMKPAMDKASSSKFRRGKHVKKAGVVAQEAAQEYNSNPLNPQPNPDRSTTKIKKAVEFAKGL